MDERVDQDLPESSDPEGIFARSTATSWGHAEGQTGEFDMVTADRGSLAMSRMRYADE